jgi:hypothetical protein
VRKRLSHQGARLPAELFGGNVLTIKKSARRVFVVLIFPLVAALILFAGFSLKQMSSYTSVGAATSSPFLPAASLSLAGGGDAALGTVKAGGFVSGGNSLQLDTTDAAGAKLNFSAAENSGTSLVNSDGGSGIDTIDQTGALSGSAWGYSTATSDAPRLTFKDNAYFDTGFTPDDNTRIVLKKSDNVATLAASTAQYSYAYGVQTTSGDDYYRFGLEYTNYNQNINYQHNTAAWPIAASPGSEFLPSPNITDGLAHIYDQSAAGLSIDGSATLAPSSAVDFSGVGRDLYIGGMDNGGTATNLFIGDIYYLQIYESGTLVHSYLPAMQNQTAGFYDTVQGKFLTPAQGTVVYAPTAPTSSDTYKPIPAYGSGDVIAQTDAPTNDGATSDPLTLTNYYGVSVNSDQPTGDYSDDVLYSAVAGQIAAPTTTSLSPGRVPISKAGVELTISGENLNSATGVFVDFNGNGSQDDGEACSGGQIADISSTDSEISCTLPSYATAGTYNLIVQTQGGQTSTSFKYFDPNVFEFTIDTRFGMTGALDQTGTQFLIPLNGQVNNSGTHSYDWVVDCNTADSTPGTVYSGTSSDTSGGIACNYQSAGQYQISIAPDGAPTDGWMDAFGFDSDSSSSTAETNANKMMLESIDVPFDDKMRTHAPGMFQEMFYYTFNLTTIPADLFSYIETTGMTDFNHMFYDTFAYAARFSSTAVIPAGLLKTIDTSDGTDFASMFEQAFYCYGLQDVANVATTGTATIPAGLFDSIDTGKGTDFASMFNGTFYGVFENGSGVATIPAGLFDSIDTSGGTDVSQMFMETFAYYAAYSPTPTAPAGLFAKISFASADPSTVVSVFSQTFEDLGYMNHAHTVTFAPGDIWTDGVNSIDFAGKITADNAGGSNGNFYETFQGDRYALTGSARTFIDNYLGGITPTNAAYTFTNCMNLGDYQTLAANWGGLGN